MKQAQNMERTRTETLYFESSQAQEEYLQDLKSDLKQYKKGIEESKNEPVPAIPEASMGEQADLITKKKFDIAIKLRSVYIKVSIQNPTISL